MNTAQYIEHSLKGAHPLQQLLRLWQEPEGEVQQCAQQFSDIYAQDYELCLVEYIRAQRCNLSSIEIELICRQFATDNQFYELAQLLIDCVFQHISAALNQQQHYVLSELIQHASLWQYDEVFIQLLRDKSLPILQSEMQIYLQQANQQN